MKKSFRVLSIILVLSLIALCFVGCDNKKKSKTGNKAESTTVNPNSDLEALGMTNIDGTPIELEPYETETGEPYVNEDGYPVYKVRNTEDENGNPVLVIKTLNVDEDGKVIFKLQKIENGVIKDAYEDDEDPQGTTTFLGNPDAIPPAKGESKQDTTKKDDKSSDDNGSGNSGSGDNGSGSGDSGNSGDNGNSGNSGKSGNGSSDNKTVDGDEILTEDLIKLGGVWGNVRKTERDNIYKGNLVESKLTELKEKKTYAGVNATFDKGVYIPETIKAEDGTVYKVRKVAYIRLFVYYDNFDEDYDWFTERGIFKPGRDDDPLVYIEDNDTFELDAEYKDIHTTFLIELAK